MSDALQTMLELAERQRDAVRSAVQQAEGASNRALAQHDQLLSYQAETRSRAPGLGGRSASAELLHIHTHFAGRLDQALEQQQRVVQQADAELQRRRALQLQAEQRVASVRKLIERRGAERAQAEARRDQRATDEAAMHRHRHGRGFDGPH